MARLGLFMRLARRVASASMLGCILIASIAHAGPRGEGSIGFIGAYPQGAFGDNVENDGYGIGFGAMFRPADSPVLIGVDLALLSYGDETRKEPFSTNIPDVEVDVTTTNSIAKGNFVLRLSPLPGAIRPYLDGLVGFNYLWTETKIEDEDSQEQIASSTNQDDTTVSYGGGGGLLVRVYSGSTEGTSVLRGVFIDLQARYLAGGKAKYLKENSIRRSGSRVVYDLSESRTDLLTFMIGATVEFGR